MALEKLLGILAEPQGFLLCYTKNHVHSSPHGKISSPFGQRKNLNRNKERVIPAVLDWTTHSLGDLG